MIQQFYSWAYIQIKLLIKKDNMHPNIHSSTIGNSQDVEAS